VYPAAWDGVIDQTPEYVTIGAAGYSWGYSLRTEVSPSDQWKLWLEVWGSWDPNDLVGPAGFGDQRYLTPEAVMPYTVFFENDPKVANAPAQEVKILNTLDDDLDLSTFELTEIAFANHTISVPAGLTSYETTIDLRPEAINAVVEVKAGLDPETRQVSTAFRAIDPDTGCLPEDPLAGFLYPNDDTHRGEGHVSYLVRPKANLPTGTQITNQAKIFFDYNDPIDTPQALNTIDAVGSTSQVEALPATTESNEFLVRWSGQDDAGGSGVAGYDLYVSTDGGPYVGWLDNATDTQATFTGEFGHTYAFYSIAKDNVGHDEAPPTVPDATIALVFPLALEAGRDQAAVEGDLVGLPEAGYTFGGDPSVLSLLVNWGDGTVEPGTLVPGADGGTIANKHSYADNATYTVSLTLSDNFGQTVEDTLTATMTNVAPTASLSSGDPVDEGSPVTVNFSDPSDPSPVDAAAGFHYSYALNSGDLATTYAAATDGASKEYTFADNGTYTVYGRIFDKDDGYTDYQTAVTVTNVPPTVAASGQSAVMLGDAFLLTLTTVDVSPVDQAGTFSYRIDWNGDGTVDEKVLGAGACTVSHVFAQAGTFSVQVVAVDKDGGQSPAATHSILVKIPVQIEVKPGDSDPALNLGSNGLIAVAVFTTTEFDARTINPGTVLFAGAQAVQWSYEDVDLDGDLDLVMHFETQKTNLQAVYTDLLLADFGLDDVLDSTRQAATVTLTGKTTDGLTLEGSDELNLFLSGKKLRELLDRLHADGSL